MKYGALFHKCLPFLSLLFLGIIIWLVTKELSHYTFADVSKSLSTISKTNIYLAILLTALGYLVISSYDVIAFFYLKYPLKISKILTTAFISYAIGNTTSFALFIGGSIRYYFYNSYGVPKKNIAKVIAFSNFSFWLGLFSIGGITFSFSPIAISKLIKVKFLAVQPLGFICLALILAYLYVSWRQKYLKIRKKPLILPSLSISLSQIIVATLDRAIAAAVLYILLPFDPNLSYWSFFVIYLLGITAAIISHVPGGLGVFETIVLYLLPKQIAVHDALASLLAFRGIYYLLPLFIALIWLGLHAIVKR